ncbi:SDR family NAD(P)-dependent oxidoreductase [Peribacillus aracenensis]|uniref:SDR family NAD(P)-dependent oxidoreductase n=1 Tax=Peribacillus aracenensis TaxID=2976708 RepID=UPI0021A3BD44|nr:SDR family NAD(P)-dependent oxidoreductase [Peribacillus sp. BBB004]
MKNIVIVGAGSGLGLALAKKFGENGYRALLVSRTQEKLDALANELQAIGIESKGYAANLYNAEEVKSAFDAIKADYGFIDIVEFSPTIGGVPTPATQTTYENALQQFDGYVGSAIRVVEQVLPDMVEKGEGAILFTTGLSALYPIPMMGNIGIALAGLRNYVMNLHTDVTDKGVYVAHLSLGMFMKAGTETDPSVAANAWYEMVEAREVAEAKYPADVTPATIIF